MCAIISKSEIGGINKASILSAMKELEKNTFDKLVDIRSTFEASDRKHKVGFKSAFLSQLCINAKMAQRILNKSSKGSEALTSH